MKLKKKVKSNKTMKKTIVPKSTSKVQSEVKRILTSNMTRMELDESHLHQDF